MKKLFLIIAALCACTLFTFAHDFEVNGIYYKKLGGDSVAVTYGSYSYNNSNFMFNINGEYSGPITILDKVEYNSTIYRVTDIGGWAFSGCSGLTSITIPNSVTSIGEYAFSVCSGLTSITIPESVTTLVSDAFYGCSGLTSITIPNSVTSIGRYAFRGCSGLTSITIGENVTSIGSAVFKGCSSLTSVIWHAKHCTNFTYDNTPFYCYDSNESYNNFNIAPQITSLTFGDSVQHIPAYLCYGMSGLTSIAIPESVTTIGEYAFRDCSGLTDITWNAKNCADFDSYSPFNGICSQRTSFTFGNEVEHIPANLCYGMSGLTSIAIPESVTTIGRYAFFNCSGLTDITWNAKNCADFDSSSPFNGICSQITSFTFGKEVEYIPAYLCDGMSNLTSITIPESVTTIGTSAFDGCSRLTSITIPESVTTISDNAFSGCSGLTSITIPESVTTIGRYAFFNCSGLTSITIPNSITTIGTSAFNGCSGLTSITIPNNVTYIGYYAFSGCSGLTSITIPESVTTIDQYAFRNCSGLTSITIGENVTTIGESAFNDCSGLTSITIPESVTTIGSCVFQGCYSLTSVIWNAKHCEDFTSDSTPFYYYDSYNSSRNSQITSFTFGDSVQHLPAYLCYGMSNLTSITIPENVTSIGNRAFSGCSNITDITWNAKNCADPKYSSSSPFDDIRSQITSFTFGNEVEHIPAELCYGMSNLTSITIPNSVTSVGWNVFKNCSSLTSVVWNAKRCADFDWNANRPLPFDNITSQITSFTFGKEVEHIPAFLCRYMNGLSNITIPNSVTSIGKWAFGECSGLTSITIGNSVTSIGEFAFYDCSSFTEITINENITFIGDNAFEGCYSLTSVIWNIRHYQDFTEKKTPFYFGDSDYSYGNPGNFDLRRQITSFTFGDGVQHIPAYICRGMKNLTTLTIPNKDVTIGTHAFSDIPEKFYNRFDNAKYFTVGKNKYHLLIAAKDTTIASCIIHPKTVAIEADAFGECTKLTNIEIPTSVTSIGLSAFSGCENITKTNYTGDIASWCAIDFGNATSNPIYHSHNLYINDVQVINLVIPDSVTTIGNYAFYDCDSLTAVSIPNSITTIGYGAFSDCNFGYLILPESLDSISGSAFANNTNLAAVKLEALTPPACNSSFESINKEIPIYVPCGSLDSYWSSKWAKEFNNIVESDFLFVAQSEDKNKGEVVVMMSPTCDEPIAMVRVEPKEGYTFVAWNDGNTETMRTVEVTDDVVYTAHFAALNGNDTTTVKDSVEIETTASTANLAWTSNPQAYYYALHVFTDAAMTDTVCKMTFDANGNILTKNTTERHIAPKHATQAGSSTLNCVVTDLETGKTYTYMLRSLDCNDIILETEIGTFQPTATTPVTGITLDKSSLELFVGATEQITATVIPATASNKNIQWTSDNEGVATVANGLITAVAKGETTITATTEDGGLTATCTVTVKDETVLENVSIDTHSSIRKVMENGTIYILRNGKRYTLDGREVSTM